MTPEDNGFKAPYPPFKTFTNFIERVAEKGLPPKIDRSYLNWLSGLGQSQLLMALREFGFIDANGVVTDRLREYVAAANSERAKLLADLLRQNYPGAVNLGTQNATQQMLEDEFKDRYKLDGSTKRKAIAFYLKAAEYAGVETSPNWRTPRTRESKPGGTRGKGMGGKGKAAQGGGGPGSGTGETPQTTATDAKSRYIDLLLKKAEDDMDDALLDRIERIIGVESKSGSPERPGE